MKRKKYKQICHTKHTSIKTSFSLRMLKVWIIKSYPKNIHQTHSMIEVITQSQSTKKILEINTFKHHTWRNLAYLHRLLAWVNHATTFWGIKNNIKLLLSKHVVKSNIEWKSKIDRNIKSRNRLVGTFDELHTAFSHIRLLHHHQNRFSSKQSVSRPNKRKDRSIC